ncbi:MAG: Dickkopf N-terminal cysteine-rich domain-containing protein [Myxococcota bacterium]
MSLLVGQARTRAATSFASLVPLLSAAALLASASGPVAAQAIQAAQEAELRLPDPAYFGELGASVSLSGDGTRAVVGVPESDVGGFLTSGALLFFERVDGSWVLEDAVVDTSESYERLGGTVSMDATGSRVVAATSDDSFFDNAVFVYARRGSRWILEQQLLPSVSTGVTEYGSTVDIDGSGSRVVVGDPSFDDVSSFGGDDRGAATVFVRSGTRWTEEAHIDLGTGSEASDRFASSVSIDDSGTRLVIGAENDRRTATTLRSGVVRVYARTGSSWIEEQLLEAATPASGDEFGQRVAMAGDGTRLFVGAPGDDIGTRANAGSATVFLRTGTTWSREATLDGVGTQGFGGVVAADESGSRFAVASRFSANTTARIYRRTGTSWSVESTLTGASGVGYGRSIALTDAGDRALVGEPLASTAVSTRGGQVAFYERTATSWALEERVFDEGAIADDNFGSATAMDRDGDRVVIGSIGEGGASGSDVGAARVYVRSTAGWALETELVPSGAVMARAQFGASLSLTEAGDRAFVGMPGSSFFTSAGGATTVFRRTGASWAREASLVASASFSRHGASLQATATGDRVVVGAPNEAVTGVGSEAGAIRVFRRTGTSWALEQRVTARTPALSERFGSAVAIDDDGLRLIAGAPRASSSRGRVQIFRRSATGTTWTHEQTLEGVVSGDGFGSTVALSADGTRAFVGAPSEDDGPRRSVGAVRVYLRTGTVWALETTLRPAPGSTTTSFGGSGTSVNDAGDRLLVGTSGDTSPDFSARTGTARLFVRSGTSWTEEDLFLHASADTDTSDAFGVRPSLSAAGTRAVVGASSDELEPPELPNPIGRAGSAAIFVLQEDLGETCATDADCGGASVCVDGLCCAAACAGQCEACDVPGFEGACVAVDGAPRGSRAACTGSGECAGVCDGTTRSACAFPGAETICGAGSCSAGTETPVVSCDGAGACPGQVPRACTPYFCSGDACGDRCSTDAECVTGNRCIDDECQLPFALGDACTLNTDCASSFCVDGVCCGSLCDAQCEGCAEVGFEGSCVPVLGAPRGTRAACAGDGSACNAACDGVSRAACAFPGAEVSCRDASCMDGVATLSTPCDGTGSCPAAVDIACAPFLCGTDACATTCAADVECSLGNYCDGGSLCVAQRVTGTACGRDGECASGLCVDGFCCDGACGGQCEACDVAGSEGTCTPVIGDPRGERPACATDGGVCGGTCDGSRGDACAFPGGEVGCREASCSDGVVTLAQGCGGAGACPPPATRECAPFLCGEDRCLGDCDTDGDCAEGNYCAGGVCRALELSGTSCGRPGQCVSGLCVDGVCCLSECGRQCEACNVRGLEGFCTAAPAGPPVGGRPACASDGTACGGSCDGRRRDRCIFADTSFVCAPASCTGTQAQEAGNCDAAGRCVTPAPRDCGDFACEVGVCLRSCTRRDQCAPGTACFGGVCQPVTFDDLGFTDDVVPPAESGGCAAGPPRLPAGLTFVVLALMAGRRRRTRVA